MADGRLMQNPIRFIIIFLLLVAACSARAQSTADSAQRHLDAGIAASVRGGRAQAIAEFEAALAIDPYHVPSMHELACEFALQGDVEKSLEWLRRSAEWGCDGAATILVEDALAAVRRDPRYAEIAERVRANRRAGFKAAEATRAAQVRANRKELERAREVAAGSVVLCRDGSTQPILHVTFDPSGEKFLAWGDDGVIRGFSPWTGEPLVEYGRHSYMNLAVSFSRDGERVLVFDEPCGRATLYDGLSGEELARIGSDDVVLDDAQLASDGAVAVTIDHRGNVVAWDTATGSPYPSFPQAADFRATGIELDPAGTRLIVTALDLAARVLDPRTGAVLATLGSDAYPVTEAHWTADGRRVVTRADGLRAGVWSLEGAADRPRLWVPDHPRAAAIAARTSPDGTRLVTPATTRGDPGAELVLWDADAARPVERLRTGNPLAKSLAFSPDGSRFGIGGGGVGWRLFDGRTGRAIAARPDGNFNNFTFSPDGRTFAGRTGPYLSDVATFDARTGDALGTVTRHGGSVTALAFSPDSARVASATTLAECEIAPARGDAERVVVSGQIRKPFSMRLDPSGGLALSAHIAGAAEARPVTGRLWSVATGLPVRDFGDFDKELLVGDFSPDGKRIVLAGDSRAGREWVRVVDAEGGSTLADFEGALDCIDARFSADGSRILATCLEGRTPPDPGSARLWDASSRELVASVPAGLTPNVLFTPLSVFSPDGSAFALAAANPSGAIEIRDARTGAPIRTLGAHSAMVRRLAFSPDGSRLLSGSLDSTTKLIDVATGEVLKILAHDWPAWDVAFDPTGRRLAAASVSGAVTVVDLSDLAAKPTVLAHPADARVVRFSPDGRTLATGCIRGGAFLFDAEDDWRRTPLVGHEATIEDAAFAAGGRRLVTTSEDGTTRVWDVPTGRLLLTRALYADGNWLAFEPHGHYTGSPAAADWARIVVKGRAFPLSSYSKILESSETIARSLAGDAIAPPGALPSAPLFELVAPASGEREDDAFRLEAIGHDDYGIDTITVLQDGRPVDAKAVEAATLASRGGRTVRLSLPLAFPSGQSSTTIVVRAENRRRILSRPVGVHLRHAAPRRELYVLALGVGDYDKDSMDLACPTKDVADLTSLLVRQDGALYDKVHVQALTDREVTLKAVRRLRDDFLLRARPEDTIIVFAAGHGIRSATNEYFFLTSDSTADDPYGGIARKDLEDLVSSEKLHARKRVLLLDTCHSGTSVRTRGASPLFGPDDQARLEESVRAGIYVIAASADDEFAREQEGNGLFTRALLDGLAGSADADKNGYVEIEELKAYAGRQVHERSGGRQVPTFPKVEGGENFRLAKVVPGDGR